MGHSALSRSPTKLKVKEFGDAYNEWKNREKSDKVSHGTQFDHKTSLRRFARIIGLPQTDASRMKRVYDNPTLMQKLKAGARWKEIIQELGDENDISFSQTKQEVVQEYYHHHQARRYLSSILFDKGCR